MGKIATSAALVASQAAESSPNVPPLRAPPAAGPDAFGATGTNSATSVTWTLTGALPAALAKHPLNLTTQGGIRYAMWTKSQPGPNEVHVHAVLSSIDPSRLWRVLIDFPGYTNLPYIARAAPLSPTTEPRTSPYAFAPQANYYQLDLSTISAVLEPRDYVIFQQAYVSNGVPTLSWSTIPPPQLAPVSIPPPTNGMVRMVLNRGVTTVFVTPGTNGAAAATHVYTYGTVGFGGRLGMLGATAYEQGVPDLLDAVSAAASTNRPSTPVRAVTRRESK